MKALVKTMGTLLFCLGIALNSPAQFKLSGQIANYSGKEGLLINIPVVTGFYNQHSIQVPVTKQGTFTIDLAIKDQKFASLIFQKRHHILLLSNKKDLFIQLNTVDTTLTPIKGTALPENKVMQAIDLEEFPFFLNWSEERLAKLSLKELQEQVLEPYAAQRKEKIEKVKAAAISPTTKLLIASELKYISYNYLNDLARTQVTDKNLMDSLVFMVFDPLDPKPEIFPAGPQYYTFVRNYLSYLETKAFKQIQKLHIKPSEPIPYFGISLDSANNIVKQYGKPYWRWIGSNQNFPQNVVEQYNYQQLLSLFMDKDFDPLQGLAQAFKAQFPNSLYNHDIDTKLATLKKLLAQNETNTQIQLMPNYEEINSIEALIKPFKGKVVYLDIWGTWCGPCKVQLQFVPALKEQFKDKDIIFLYLDMDEDDKDASWQQFIRINGIAGVHLRKNRKTIAPLWKELLANADDKAEYYPQYFIFDKAGKLVVTKAKRPSEKEELYQQLNDVLHQK